MSPSADLLQTSSTAAKRVVSQPGPSAQSMALQRSEFEDFMNAYRPTFELTKAETPKPTSHDDSKADFGRSIKRLMKRTQTSPSVTNKNHKKESGQSQRLPPPREKNIANELKPLPVSHVKKASRPGSMIVESTSLSIPFQSKPIVPPTLDINTLPKLESQTKNGAKLKSERNGSQDQQKLTSEDVSATTTSPSPASIRRELSLQDSVLQQQQKEIPMMMMTMSSQPPTPTIIERDAPCLLIARNSLPRFLPPRRNPDPLTSLRVMEIPDRKFKVILEFEEAAPAALPPLSNSGLMVESPIENIHPSSWDQLDAFAWVRESRMAATGMLLINVEKATEFPYVTYLLLSGSRSELCQKVNQIRSRPVPANHTQLHFVAGYEEAVTVCRPPFTPIPEKPSSDSSGFIVFLYQVLPGDDGARFEQNWVMWTGARQLYIHAPDYMGFKRISVLKSILPTEIVVYAMICEFSTIMDYLTEACVLVDKLRARCCGFTGIYRILDSL